LTKCTGTENVSYCDEENTRLTRREKEKSVTSPADEYPGAAAASGEILTVFPVAFNF